MDNAKNIQNIIKVLKQTYQNAKCALNHKNAFELLIATILSAQCTDERVNIVTTQLFKKYKTPKDLANAKIEELEQEVRSTGFYKNKAKNIKASSKVIVEHFSGRVPNNMNDLLTLPGVARKTANVVLGTWFNISSGIVVDTHVLRISYLLGLTKQKNPEKVEQELMKIVQKQEWINFSHMLIWHGRKICIARRPKCEICPLNKLCPSAFKVNQIK